MDGRSPDALLGTPGGDAGEFILALFIYEGMLGGNRKLTQDAVDSFLINYLKLMKRDKFYMCTDDESLEHLERELGISLNIDMLRSPKQAYIEELLKALVKADN